MKNLVYLCVLTTLASAKPQISGLTQTQATLAGIAGLGGAIVIGGALGKLAAQKTNSLFGRSRSSSSYYSGGYRHGRRKREAMEIEHVLQVLALMDNNDCGKRYLCELAAAEPNELNKSETSTLQLFLGKSEDDSEISKFRSAANYGRVAKNFVLCHNRYKKCALGKQAIKDLLKKEELETENNLV